VHVTVRLCHWCVPKSYNLTMVKKNVDEKINLKIPTDLLLEIGCLFAAGKLR